MYSSANFCHLVPLDFCPLMSYRLSAEVLVGETEAMADYSKGLQLAFFLILTNKKVKPMRLKETEPEVM